MKFLGEKVFYGTAGYRVNDFLRPFMGAESTAATEEPRHAIISFLPRPRRACSGSVRARGWRLVDAMPPASSKAQGSPLSCRPFAEPEPGDRAMSDLWGQSPAPFGRGRRPRRIAPSPDTAS